MNKPPAFVKARRAEPPKDKLEELAALARNAKLLETDIIKLEELLAKAKADYNVIIMEKIPDAMDSAGVSKLTFNDPNTNEPFELAWKNFYHASISTDWEPNKRIKAFKYLEDLGEGDLIKTEVIISFAREDRKKALKVISDLKAKDIRAEIKENVHHMTLTAWLKNQIETKNFTPELTTIGATVGRKAVVK